MENHNKFEHELYAKLHNTPRQENKIENGQKPTKIAEYLNKVQ